MPIRIEAMAGTSALPVSALSNDQLAGLLDAWARSGVRVARTDLEKREILRVAVQRLRRLKES